MESQKKIGKLKIYLGFAPGVGKTFTMLREAVYMKKQNYDVVIGWLEDNAREDTLELAKDLEFIKPKEIVYKEKIFKEIDLEAIINRNPGTVLIDELAHSNIDSSMNKKRYQDVEYILNHGIDVVTTINIYHIEGVNKEASIILGNDIYETVPDSFISSADEVQLIDALSQLMQQRLREGKVFKPRMINSNTYSLFSSSKLLALRELALRYVANEVNEHWDDFDEKNDIYKGTYVYEKILSCVSSIRIAEKIIAKGAEVANRMSGEFYILHVLVDKSMQESEKESEILHDYNLSNKIKSFKELADKYEAELIVIKVSKSSLITKEIARIVIEKEITQVVIGELGVPRIKEIVEGSFVNKIIKDVPGADIYIAGRNIEIKNEKGNKKIQKGIASNLQKGKLKIYIGAAAGAGKTVAMLREAHELIEKKVDVAIGFIETHNREETKKYTEGLEQISLKEILYHNVNIKEPDIDKIIKRDPDIVLIDELAHTNPDGLKNKKRFEDIYEILSMGIDVITAVNVQHIESLNDIVEDITGVKIKETIPDSVIAKANEIVLVDVTPETLRERLEEGKIYDKSKVEQALNNFFKKENLQTLRELGLREVAQEVKINNPIEKKKSRYIEDRVLACAKLHENSERLIRRGFKIAQSLNAKFIVLHLIDNNRRYSMEESQRLDLLKQLTTTLGGEFVIERVSNDRKIKSSIIDYIKKKNISMLILGEPDATRIEEIWQGSIVNYFLTKLKGLDILFVDDINY
jgi:two-component system sensor histidine kinase KdpD